MVQHRSFASERKEQVERLLDKLKINLERKYWPMYFAQDYSNNNDQHNSSAAKNCLIATFYRQDKYSDDYGSGLEGLQYTSPYNMSITVTYNYRNADNLKFSSMKMTRRKDWEGEDCNHFQSIFSINTEDKSLDNLVNMFDACYQRIGEKVLNDRRREEAHYRRLDRMFPDDDFSDGEDVD